MILDKYSYIGNRHLLLYLSSYFYISTKYEQKGRNKTVKKVVKIAIFFMIMLSVSSIGVTYSHAANLTSTWAPKASWTLKGKHHAFFRLASNGDFVGFGNSTTISYYTASGKKVWTYTSKVGEILQAEIGRDNTTYLSELASIDWKTRIIAINKKGKILWKTSPGFYNIQLNKDGDLYASKNIIRGGETNFLISFDTKNGKVKWKKTIGGDIPRIYVAGNRIIVETFDYYKVLDHNGKSLFTIPIKNRDGYEPTDQPIVNDQNEVFVSYDNIGDNDNTFELYSATGKKIFSLSSPMGLKQRRYWYNPSPYVFWGKDKIALNTLYSSSLSVINKSGKVLWKIDSEKINTNAHDFQILYTDSNYIYIQCSIYDYDGNDSNNKSMIVKIDKTGKIIGKLRIDDVTAAINKYGIYVNNHSGITKY